MRRTFLSLLLCLVLGSATGLTGCSHPRHSSLRPNIVDAPALSDQAQAIYAYLQYLYLDGDSALQALNTALSLDPSPELFLEKIHFYWNHNDYKGAEKTAEGALHVVPGHPSLTMALIRTLWAQGKSEEAALHVDQALKQQPQNWNLRSHLANYLLQQKQPSRALDILLKIPNRARTANMHYLLAQAYSGLDNQKKTIFHLEKATQKDPSLRKAWAELGYQHELSRNLVAAEKAYSTLLDMGETSSQIILRLVEIELKLNTPDHALDLMVSHADQKDVLLRGIGLLLQNGFYQHAAQALERAEHDITNSAHGFLYQAILAWEMENDLDKASQILGQIHEQSELHPRALALHCQLLWEQGSVNAALELAAEGQNAYPEREIFYSLQARIFRSQDMTDKARQILLSGLDALPNNPEFLFQLGAMCYEQGQVQKAISHMEQIINHNPEHAQALNFLGYTLVELEQNLERARILIQKALELDPENGYYLDSLAWYQYTVGHTEQAWETIQAAVDYVADDSVIWEHYGDIARALNKIRDAAKGYQRSLENKTDHPRRLNSKLRALQHANGTDAP
jgi:tetratricopeptide (TPR) repeat protein